MPKWPRVPAWRRLGLYTLSAVASMSGAARAADWYVDGRDGQRANPGSAAAPFRFVWQGFEQAGPGDTIHILPTALYPPVSVSLAGTASAPITLTGGGVEPHLTRIVGDAMHPGILVRADYVVIAGFDVTAAGRMPALAIGEGHHHVTIAGNVLHDAGGDGIVSVGNDYLLISHNVVQGNAGDTSRQVFASGISIINARDVDAETGVKIAVEGNVVDRNSNAPQCATAACKAKAADSDGSGIIVDDSRHTTGDGIVYGGRTLISNNIVFGNGGSGVEVYRSDHVSVSGNTMYRNNQDPYQTLYHPGEISALFAGDVLIAGNLLVSDGGRGAENGRRTSTHVAISVQYCTDGSGPIVARDNTVFVDHRAASGADPLFAFTWRNTNWTDLAVNRVAEPEFVHPSLDPATADFRLRPKAHLAAPAASIGKTGL